MPNLNQIASDLRSQNLLNEYALLYTKRHILRLQIVFLCMSLFLLFVFSLSFKELDALKKLLFSSAILGGMGFLYYKDRKNLFFEYIIPLTFGKEATVTYYEPIKISRYFIDMYWHIKYGFIVPDTDLQFDSSVTIPIKMVNNDNTIFDTPRVFYIKENPYISSIATKELLNKFCLRKRS